MRIPGLVAAAALMVAWGGVPAHAGLLDGGTNTVDAQFYFGAPDAVPVDTNVPDSDTLENEGILTIQNPGGAHYGEGASDLSNIDVGDATITITNDVTGPYCTTSLPCPDIFTGFEFLFSSGVDIAGVTVDPSSDADMLPTTLSLLSPTEILVNMSSATNSPLGGDTLTLDLTFPTSGGGGDGGGGGTTGVPEPSSLAILGAGLAGLYLRRSRRKSA